MFEGNVLLVAITKTRCPTWLIRTRRLLIGKDKLGNTPLHLALRPRAGRYGSTAEAAELLRAGADPLLADGEGNSSLHIIACSLHQAEFHELFKDFLNRGCDINARNKRGETPLFSANWD
ncbi:hypothetical protein F5B18DRAFT_604187, partial [Nemania serpens]